MVITGASDGIGLAAARILAVNPDNRLVLVGRNPDKTRRVAEELGVTHLVADFEQLDEVRRLAGDLLACCERIDVLANNAGGMFDGPVITVDGFERTFQVNHLAPVLLTNLLIDRLLESRARVVNTASLAAKMYSRLDFADLQTLGRFSRNRAYGNAKLANILFAKGLDFFYAERGLHAVSFHPGVIATNFASGASGLLNSVYHGYLRRFLTPPASGGASLAYFAAGSPGCHWRSGEYYDDHRRPGIRPRLADDLEVVLKHWRMSADLLKISWPAP